MTADRSRVAGVAWIGPWEKSRVVVIQLGHGKEAHENANYRRLVRNAIVWAAGRTLSSAASKDFRVRLDPPRVAVVSMKHYLNHGGSELVVYRATPPDVQSGVRVGAIEYPGFALGGDLKAAFFALLHDQPLNTPIVAFARDEADNEAHTAFVDNVFEKPFKKSRIALDDRFLNRVVPEILQRPAGAE
jgi:hypothetical protein